jgi:hypothetical protein
VSGRVDVRRSCYLVFFYFYYYLLFDVYIICFVICYLLLWCFMLWVLRVVSVAWCCECIPRALLLALLRYSQCETACK